MSDSLEKLIRIAVQIAGSSSSLDLPIGAVITDSAGGVLSQAANSVGSTGDVTAHAEIVALRKLGMLRPKSSAINLTLAVTLEPCPMCAWAIRSAGIGSVVFGAYNDQYGACGSVFDLLRDNRHGPAVEVRGGVLEMECSALLDKAFSQMRDNSKR